MIVSHASLENLHRLTMLFIKKMSLRLAKGSTKQWDSVHVQQMMLDLE